MTEPYQTEEKPVGNYPDVEIKRAEIHEKAKTEREKIRQREETKRALFAGRTGDFYFLRLSGFVAALGALGLSWGITRSVLHAKDPPNCGDIIISIADGASCACTGQRAVSIAGDKGHLLCTTIASVQPTSSAQ